MSDMNEQPTTNYRTYQGVKLEILKHIAKYGAPGQRLSSEREWCDLLQVSRSTIRQALQSLEIKVKFSANAEADGMYLHQHCG